MNDEERRAKRQVIEDLMLDQRLAEAKASPSLWRAVAPFLFGVAYGIVLVIGFQLLFLHCTCHL